MTKEGTEIQTILAKKSDASIRVLTLGSFQLWRSDELIRSKEWSRDSALQLFQFFITNRQRHSLHKDQIIDRIWGDMDFRSGQQNFKVALHGVNKVLEPKRKSRTESKFIRRQGASYQLDLSDIWIDVDAIDHFIKYGNLLMAKDQQIATTAYKEAIELFKGMYLPNRLYEDWSSEERERIQLLILGAIINRSELLIKSNPMESVRLTQQALQIDNTWEDAYRIQMQAYIEKGNRPMAIKTYQLCEEVLEKEFGITPLPETQRIYLNIKEGSS